MESSLRKRAYDAIKRFLDAAGELEPLENEQAQDEFEGDLEAAERGFEMIKTLDSALPEKAALLELETERVEAAKALAVIDAKIKETREAAKKKLKF